MCCRRLTAAARGRRSRHWRRRLRPRCSPRRSRCSSRGLSSCSNRSRPGTHRPPGLHSPCRRRPRRAGCSRLRGRQRRPLRSLPRRSSQPCVFRRQPSRRSRRPSPPTLGSHSPISTAPRRCRRSSSCRRSRPCRRRPPGGSPGPPPPSGWRRRRRRCRQRRHRRRWTPLRWRLRPPGPGPLPRRQPLGAPQRRPATRRRREQRLSIGPCLRRGRAVRKVKVLTSQGRQSHDDAVTVNSVLCMLTRMKEIVCMSACNAHHRFENTVLLLLCP